MTNKYFMQQGDMWCPKNLNADKAKYIAIADALQIDIKSGQVLPGEQLPPQRELAERLSVNLTTISRAYREAERRGLIKGTVGRGTFVSSDARKILDQPDSRLFKTDEIEMGMVLSLFHLEPDLEERMAKLAVSQDLTGYGRYSEPAGLSQHLAVGSEWVKRFGLNVGLNQLVITAGAQHALTCTLVSCFKPGNRIAVDCLTYPGLKNLAAMMNIRLVPVEMDADGMVPDSLRVACKRNRVNGVYLMPGFHNPTCITMSSARRQELITIIEEYQLLLIEDDPYFFLADDVQPAMSSYLPNNSIFISSFSKILYAGLRTAFVVSSRKFRLRLAGAILNTIWMAPALNIAVICDAIVDGTVNRVIRRKVKEAKIRNDIAWSILPFDENTLKSNGFYIWYQLPEPWSGYAFEAHAKKKRINVSCAEQFTVGSPDIHQAVRICLTAVPSRQELKSGLSGLVEILEAGCWPLEGNSYSV